MNKTIIKKDIANKLSKETGLTLSESLMATEALMKIITSNVSSGNKVVLRGLGSFNPILRKPKVGRNITAKTQVIIPGTCTVKFKPSIGFKKSVSKIVAVK